MKKTDYLNWECTNVAFDSGNGLGAYVLKNVGEYYDGDWLIIKCGNEIKVMPLKKRKEKKI